MPTVEDLALVGIDVALAQAVLLDVRLECGKGRRRHFGKHRTQRMRLKSFRSFLHHSTHHHTSSHSPSAHGRLCPARYSSFVRLVCMASKPAPPRWPT